MLRLRHMFHAFACALFLGAPVIVSSEENAAATTTKPLFTAVVRTTAYTHTEADHLAYGAKNAFGTGLSYTPEYHSVAADWSKFPLGTKFKIKGYDRLFIVDDYGSALVGTKTLDLYFPDRKRMNNWGVRIVNIEVLELGSFQTSFRVLAERGKHPHCLKMMASLMKVDWNQPRVRQ
jgi:3D (Asp-Asp-Asp) domain-containing protein